MCVTYKLPTPSGKYTKAALAEEEQCEDLLIFMRMLAHLTTKDYLDFGESTSNAVQPVDVIITGIGIVLPLLNEEILKVGVLQLVSSSVQSDGCYTPHPWLISVLLCLKVKL